MTDHWRKYVSPLMWRCQWLELRMKDLQSQVSKYDKELAVLKHEKELQTKMIELDCSSSRSVPFSSLCCRKTMKRRRRKRNEDKIDTSSYISNHTVLSYFGKSCVLLLHAEIRVAFLISRFNCPAEKMEADGHSIEDNANLGNTVNCLMSANKYDFPDVHIGSGVVTTLFASSCIFNSILLIVVALELSLLLHFLEQEIFIACILHLGTDYCTES